MYRSANPQISFHSSYNHFFLLFFNSPTFFAVLIHTYSIVWSKQIWLRCFLQSALCCATHRQSRKKYLWRRRCRDWGCCCQLWGDPCLDEPISILWRWPHLPEPNGPVFLDELFLLRKYCQLRSRCKKWVVIWSISRPTFINNNYEFSGQTNRVQCPNQERRKRVSLQEDQNEFTLEIKWRRGGKKSQTGHCEWTIWDHWVYSGFSERLSSHYVWSSQRVYSRFQWNF